MIEGRQIRCDVCDRAWASIPPGAALPVYTPLDFCPGCAMPAVVLIRIWAALPAGEAAALAARMVELVDGGPYSGKQAERLPDTLRDLAAHVNGHLKDAVRNGAYSARELYLTELPGSGIDWMLGLIGSADWSLTLRLAELAPFLARLEPDERQRLDGQLESCLDVPTRGKPAQAPSRQVRRQMDRGTANAPAGTSESACAGATHTLQEIVFRSVAVTLMIGPGTLARPESEVSEDALAAEFGITTVTMRAILTAMQRHGLVSGR